MSAARQRRVHDVVLAATKSVRELGWVRGRLYSALQRRARYVGLPWMSKPRKCPLRFGDRACPCSRHLVQMEQPCVRIVLRACEQDRSKS
jgi:hypothetical protein